MNDFDLGTGLGVLRRTPATLDALLRGADEALVHATEGQDTFSPFDVVGHLIDGEETDWLVRARIILDQGTERTFAPYDRYRHRHRNAGRAIGDLLDEFTALRRRNLEQVIAWHLTPAQLDLVATHPAFGPVTLGELLASWVVHDLGHIAQVSRVMAKHFRHAVGPWRAYLPVLDDRPRPAS